jgi:beta-glucosidase
LGTRQFPDGFLWGAATAAYQIEGAAHEDGRTPSIWDVFARTPGKVRHGDTGDIACDHYHRFDEDLDLVASLGLGAYRLSLAWPRLQPHGAGALNPRALDHYRRVLDGLRARDITAMVTLYHWDLPAELQDEGGWTSRATAERFAEYSGLVAEALGDEVPMWITLNEPYCSSFLGHLEGRHAPGLQDGGAALAAAHHLLLGHGWSVQALRAAGATGEVGITLNLSSAWPATDDPESVAAARRVDGRENRWFLDPIFRGAYPADMVELQRPLTDMRWLRDGDLATIAEPLDFVGVNFYERHFVEPNPDDPRGWIKQPDPGPLTGGGIGIHPDGLREVLVRVAREYTDLPLYVTENGAAFFDYVDPEGGVDDEERVAFLDGHLRAVAQAIDEGADVRGYFVWSLLDNFEWADGYSRRFGIVYVDYRTQERVPKLSAAWYAGVARTNALGQVLDSAAAD